MKKGTRKQLNIVGIILTAVIFLTGIGLLLYPQISDWCFERKVSELIDEYAQTVDNMPVPDYESMRSAAEEYNSRLAYDEQRWTRLEDEDIEEYNGLLDVNGEGLIGYVEIPRLGVTLPINHGVSEEILQSSLGHMNGSSLPIGGNNTHAVISGHSGMASAKLFTKLDTMEVGDTFVIHVLGEELVYEVDRISITLPDELEYLSIEENMDYVTLMTCTPYGVNSHRLLVRGVRIG